VGKPEPGDDFWALIERHTGEITATNHTARGYSSDVTVIVECAGGPLFVKAVREPSQHESSLAREAAINPYVRSVSPALRWQLRERGWIVLAFDAVPGDHADFTPGSPDLAAVTDAIDAIGTIDCPDVARRWPEVRWNRFASDPAPFVGDRLLYTDINPDNLLISSSGISVVDWSWPTHGAGFIDPACLVVQLVAAGHTPTGAEDWAQRCSAWRAADPEAIDAFAAATVRMYDHFEKRDPAPWRKAMTEAAASWAVHRGTAP
jgi:hypothetical protein